VYYRLSSKEPEKELGDLKYTRYRMDVILMWRENVNFTQLVENTVSGVRYYG
jgi:hypothetical protein